MGRSNAKKERDKEALLGVPIDRKPKKRRARAHPKEKVLRAVRLGFERGMTFSEVQNETGYAVSTVTKLLNELLDDDYIVYKIVYRHDDIGAAIKTGVYFKNDIK